MKMNVLGRLAIVGCLIVASGCTSGRFVGGGTSNARQDEKAVDASSAPSTDQNHVPTADVSQSNEEALRFFVDDSGVAIRGTDPVAYFTEGAAMPGSADFTHYWGNATWQFASAGNRDLFAANPEKYAPQYGGFCAWAVSEGYTAPIDPEAWRIVDGRLYLNFDRRIQQRWERDIPGHISQADANWPAVLDES